MRGSTSPRGSCIEARLGERFILELIDWETNADPWFYENRHLRPLEVQGDTQAGCVESWVYYNTNKFSGKKIVIGPGCTFRSRDAGVHSVLVLAGTGTYAGHRVQGGNPDMDELLVVHDAAVSDLKIHNDDPHEDLVLIKFFGPDLNHDVPMIPPAGRAAHGA